MTQCSAEHKNKNKTRIFLRSYSYNPKLYRKTLKYFEKSIIHETLLKITYKLFLQTIF
jgi:hypothetical protein